MTATHIFQPTATTSTPTGYSLHQLQGNKNHGSEKEGYLLKKSEGMLKKVWQKRKCRIKDGILSVSHSDVSRFFLHLIWGRLLVPSQFKNVLNLQTKVNNIFNFLVLHLCENNHENQTNVSKIQKISFTFFCIFASSMQHVYCSCTLIVWYVFNGFQGSS